MPDDVEQVATPTSSCKGQEPLAFPGCVLREFETPLTRDLKYGEMSRAGKAEPAG